MTNSNLIRSYLPRNRGINSSKKSLMHKLMPKFQINLNDDLENLLSHANNKIINFEIGAGDGSFISKVSESNRDELFITSEVYIQGILHLLENLENNSISNVKIWPDDGRLLLMKIPDNLLSNIFILFPDPWPKARHHKRRLINKDFLSLLSQKLRAKSNVYIVTDHESYASWIQEHFSHDNRFKPVEDFEYNTSKYLRMMQTKYHEKAIKTDKDILAFCYSLI